MCIFLVGGSWALSVFTSTHFEVKDMKESSTPTRKYEMEQDKKKLMDSLSLEEFSLSVRIPRPEDQAQTIKDSKQNKLNKINEKKLKSLLEEKLKNDKENGIVTPAVKKGWFW